MSDLLEDLKQQILSEKRWDLRSLNIHTYHVLQQATRSDKRNFKWRLMDTAIELEMSMGYVSESLKLAKALHCDIDIKHLTRDEALKKLKGSVL